MMRCVLLLCLFSSLAIHLAFAEDSEILKGLSSKDLEIRIETLHKMRQTERTYQTSEILALTKLLMDETDVILALEKAFKDPQQLEKRFAQNTFKIVFLKTAAIKDKDAVLRSLLESDSEVIISAIWALASLKSIEKKAIVLELRNAFSHPDSLVRYRAAVAFTYLFNDSAKEAVPELRKALTDSNSKVRGIAAQALATINDVAVMKDLAPELRKALSDPNARVRKNAAEALRKMGAVEKDAMSELRKALSDPNASVRKNAAGALGKMGAAAKDAVPELRKVLSDPDVSVRLSVAEALCNMWTAAKDAVPELRKALSDLEPLVRRYALKALWNTGAAAKDAVPELRKALSDLEPRVRRNAAYVLGDMGAAAKDAVPELRKALSDPDASVRQSVAYALVRMRVATKDVVPELRKALSDLEPWVRQRAAEALVRMGATAKDAVPELRKALSDPDSRVSNLAKEALERIDGQKEEPIKFPTPGNRTSICDSLKAILQNKNWQGVKGHLGLFGVPSDSWDTAINSLKQLFLQKTLGIYKAEEISPCRSPSSDPTEEFALSMLSLMQRSANNDDPDWSGDDIYAKIFRAHLLKSKGQPEKADEILKLLVNDVSKLKTSGIGGSAFNTYAYGVTMIALGSSAPDSVWKRFTNWVGSFGDPMTLAYNPETNTPESHLAAAARNVPVHLALFLKEKGEKRQKNLSEALENWWKYSGNLADEVPHDGTHKGVARLAPYYFFSSLPYITAAIKILERDPDISTEEKTKIFELKKNCEKHCQSLLVKMDLSYLREVKTIPKHSMFLRQPITIPCMVWHYCHS